MRNKCNLVYYGKTKRHFKEQSKLIRRENEKEYVKYLGVLIKNISQPIGIMYKLRPFLPVKVMKNGYYSLFSLYMQLKPADQPLKLN